MARCYAILFLVMLGVMYVLAKPPTSDKPDDKPSDKLTDKPSVPATTPSSTDILAKYTINYRNRQESRVPRPTRKPGTYLQSVWDIYIPEHSK